MGQPGDINDELDDDTLRSSIESSTSSGEWRDENAAFGDPRLEAIAKQLAEAPRTTYTERRLAELDRRNALKERHDAAKAAAPEGNPEPAAGPADWRDTVVVPGSPAPRAPAKPSAAGARPKAALSGLFAARALVTSCALFAVALGAQAAIAGWQPSLAVRGALAAFATGIAWIVFGEGRYRSATIATGAYLMAFVSTGGANTGPEVFAAFLGTAIVMLGAGALRPARH